MAFGGQDPSIINTPLAAPTKKAFDRNGNQVDVGSGIPLQQWQPDTGYAGTNYFEAAPPQQRASVAAPAQAPRASISALTGGGATGAVGQGSATAAPTGPSYQDIWAREDRQRAEDQKRRDDIMSRILSQPTSARVERAAGPTAEQESAARDAAFARAKETAGQNARASMSALNDVVDSRGLMGSSVEAAQTGALVGGAADQVGNFLRDQAQSEADKATHVADVQYQGNVQQRAQELSRQQALLGLLAGGGLY